MSFSGFFNKRSTIQAPLGLVSARCLKRSLLMAISAVLDPEKKAEKPTSATNITSINMRSTSLIAYASNDSLLFQKEKKMSTIRTSEKH